MRHYIVYIFVVMIILCSGLTLHAQDGSLTLQETLDMLNEDLEQTSVNHPEDYPDAVQYWISVLEQIIPASTESDHKKNSATVMLSNLYQRDNRNDQALLALENMFVNSSDTALVISSALDAANLSASLGEPVDRIIGFTDMFLDLVNTHRDTDRYFPVDLYDEKYHDIDLIRSSLLWNSAQVVRDRFSDKASRATIEAAPVYILSIGYLKPFIKTKIDSGEIYDPFGGVPKLLQDLAEIYIELAELYSNSNNTEQSRQAREDAIESYESILFDFPDITTNDSFLTGLVAESILEQKLLLDIPLDEFVGYSHEISEYVSTGSGYFPGALNAIAGNIKFLKRNDPQVIAAAYSLYALCMEMEVARLPDSYKDLPNYQDSIICAAECALGMNDFAQVELLLEEISTLGNLGTVSQDILAGIITDYEKHMADFTSAPSPDDSHPEIVTHVTDTAIKTPSKDDMQQRNDTDNERKPAMSLDTTNNQNTSATQNLPYLYIGSIVGILLLVGCGVVLYRRA